MILVSRRSQSSFCNRIVPSPALRRPSYHSKPPIACSAARAMTKGCVTSNTSLEMPPITSRARDRRWRVYRPLSCAPAAEERNARVVQDRRGEGLERILGQRVVVVHREDEVARRNRRKRVASGSRSSIGLERDANARILRIALQDIRNSAQHGLEWTIDNQVQLPVQPHLALDGIKHLRQVVRLAAEAMYPHPNRPRAWADARPEHAESPTSGWRQAPAQDKGRWAPSRLSLPRPDTLPPSAGRIPGRQETHHAVICVPCIWPAANVRIAASIFPGDTPRDN